jgi:hypothetical protein
VISEAEERHQRKLESAARWRERNRMGLIPKRKPLTPEDVAAQTERRRQQKLAAAARYSARRRAKSPPALSIRLDRLLRTRLPAAEVLEDMVEDMLKEGWLSVMSCCEDLATFYSCRPNDIIAALNLGTKFRRNHHGDRIEGYIDGDPIRTKNLIRQSQTLLERIFFDLKKQGLGQFHAITVISRALGVSNVVIGQRLKPHLSEVADADVA